MRDDAPVPKYECVQLTSSKWIRASASGLYHSYIRTGEVVSKGQVIGLIAGPYGEFEKKVKSTMSGHVIAINNIPVINRGDALMHIGTVG